MKFRVIKNRNSKETKTQHFGSGNNGASLKEHIINHSQNLRIPGKKANEVYWDRLLSRVNESNKVEDKFLRLNSSKKLYTWISVAASVAIIVVFVYTFYQPNPILISTQNGIHKTIILPDSSQVVLNSASHLAYNEKNWNKSRNIKLEGEAFFTVKTGSWFTISTNNGSVKVLGTRFNVLDRGSKFNVFCYDGKVSVESNHSNVKVELRQYEYTELDNLLGLSTVKIFDKKPEAPWINGDFYFNSESLDYVLEEMERQFDVVIEYTSVQNRLYTGYFSTKNLAEAIELVCKPMGLGYTFKDSKTIVILGQ